ncbi:MAG: DUF1385 domain-containing protein [Acidobacteria bacterium]|nr:DUF1385 domain-containing protein [Acidobacteriota bacterium]MBI3421490.1 DUF1385 domain-containing protein [Acidobacteriota bacterium]
MKPEKEIIVGGQAVIEGVMMRAPHSYAVAVRRQDGQIVSKAEPLPKLDEKYPWLKIPVLRGSAVLIHSMALGIKALNFSATVAMEEQEAVEQQVQPAVKAAAATGVLMTTAHAIEAPEMLRAVAETEEKPKSSAAAATAAGSMVFALIFNVLLFIVLPLLVTNALFIYFGWGNAPQATFTADANAPWYQAGWHWLQAYMKPVRPSVSFNLLDGVIRMGLFLLMIWSFSRLQDIKRIFEYHGAEHKTVFAWEAGEELTVANARRHPRQHPRCGTSFLMVVMLVSIVLFSVVKFDALLLNMLTRIALMPLIAGISYEIIRAAGKKESSALFSLMTLPGLWLQNVTTQEPSDDQLEVAIYALKESLKLEPQEPLAVGS